MDEFLQTISDLFLGNGVIVILGCFVIGMFLKGSIKSLKNQYIPYINAVVAVVLGFIIPGTLEEESIPAKVIVLAFMGLASVGLYEALCIAVKDRFSINIKKLYNNSINLEEDKESSDSSQKQEDLPQEYEEDNTDETDEEGQI